MREIITIDDAIAVLNEMLDADVAATAALLANRVPCNSTLSDHPGIQVQSQHGAYFVGLMGVINGLFGTYSDGWGPINYVFEEDPSDNKMRLVRFERVRKIGSE